MSRLGVWNAAALLLVLGTTSAPAADLDSKGEPLPAGALARLNTVRQRQRGPVLSLAFSPDGRTLAGGSGDGTIRLWDPATGKELRTLSGHRNRYAEDRIVALAFSPDGRQLASSSANCMLILWDVQAGKEQHRHEMNYANLTVTHVRFSPDARTVAARFVFG